MTRSSLSSTPFPPNQAGRKKNTPDSEFVRIKTRLPSS